MQPLLRRLKIQGFMRSEEESMHQFLLRYSILTPHNAPIKKIDRLYEEILYADDSDKRRIIELKKLVKSAVKYAKIPL
jgi:hypothetical protein